MKRSTPRSTMHTTIRLAAPRLAAMLPVVLIATGAQGQGGGHTSAPPPVTAAAAAAPSPAATDWQFGAVLDLASTSRPLALGGRDQGLQLGHSDLSASGPLGRHLRAQLNAVVATHDGRAEAALEEAWIETRSLPPGLSARAGRFSSQIGQLNAQHPHADDFVERPLLYRAFLGGHWYDDGLRLNITLPTGLYWMLGAEAFRGRQLVREAESPVGGAGAFTLATKVGGDLGRSSSWQLGLAWLKNRRTAAQHDEHADEDGAAHDHGHDHAHGHHHGAAFGGRHLWLLDATWKWAPGGSNRQQQLRVGFEAARVSGINAHATGGERHEAQSLHLVWRFNPHWEVGTRLDRLRVAVPHGDHFHPGRLDEQALMLAWKPSHLQTLRLQATRQSGAQGIESPARRSLALQYVLAFGAHGAHAF